MSKADTLPNKPFRMELIERRHGNRPYREVENELLLQGMTDKQIAEHLGVSKPTVYQYRKLLGYDPVRTNNPVIGSKHS